MQLLTWNVNSPKVRMPRGLELLDTLASDVVLMQEIAREIRKASKPSDHAPLITELG